MIDILSSRSNDDLGIADTEVEKASNILSVQLGSLEYAPSIGVDFNFFLSPNYKFQNESFKTYLTHLLSENSINVASVIETIETFNRKYAFNLTDQAPQAGLISR